MKVLLQIVRRVCQRKRFENRLVFSKDMDRRLAARFFDSQSHGVSKDERNSAVEFCLRSTASV